MTTINPLTDLDYTDGILMHEGIFKEKLTSAQMLIAALMLTRGLDTPVQDVASGLAISVSTARRGIRVLKEKGIFEKYAEDYAGVKR